MGRLLRYALPYSKQMVQVVLLIILVTGFIALRGVMKTEPAAVFR